MLIRSKALRLALSTLTVFLAAFLLAFSQVLFGLNAMVADPLYQRAGSPDSRIRILAIDEKTVAAYGEPALWSREIPARLVELLNADEESRPAVIAFDLLYPSEKDPAGDARFAEAARAGGNVVTAVNLVYRARLSAGEQGLAVDEGHVELAELPYPALAAASRAGFANTELDRDQNVRYARLYAAVDGQALPSFPLAILQAWMGEGVALPATDSSGKFTFQYTGRSGSYEVISLADVLEGRIDTRVFRQSVVLVGAYAPGMMDAYQVPVIRSGQMYGVEIHANILEALLEGRTALRAPQLLYALAVALLAAAYWLLSRRLSPVKAGLLGLGFIGLDLLAGVLLYRAGVEIRVIELLAAVLLIFAWRLASGYLKELLNKRRILSAFKQYVAPQVVEELANRGDFDIRLGGERRHVAVLFVDIRDFTPMSEGLQPEQVVEILNEYLGLTTGAIFKNGGTLDKFIGDTTMAVFNAPFDLDDYIYRAVCTARDIASGSDELEKKLMERFGKSVSFGIGVNCGDAVVGNIGCDFRMDYTAIGDTVNTAARLESNARRGQILISDAVYQAVKDRVRVTEVGAIPLKGKSNEVFVYQLDEVM